MGMANVLNEEKKQQVLALGRLGWPLRQIQKVTRIRRETVSAYLKAAGIAVRPPGAWGRRAPKPANEVITDFGAAKPTIPVTSDPNPNPENLSTKGKSTSKPANENGVITGFGVELSATEGETSHKVRSTSFCEPYREAVELGLSRGRNARAIWQDLVTEYSFANNYQSVQRFVRKLRGTQAPEARVVIVTAPGQEAQVDYGSGPMVRDSETGKYRRTRLFVMTLGCSRKSVRLLTFRSSARIWAELHERAFRRLGGATRIVVLDNLREGVLVPDIYDPALNPIPSIVTCSLITAQSLCRVASRILIAKARSNPVLVMRREHLSKVCTSRVWKKLKPTLIAGKNVGLTPASTAPPNAKSLPCLRKRNHSCFRCRLSPSAITSTASASCI